MIKGHQRVPETWTSGKTIVIINERYFRPTEVDLLIGDYSKAKEKLGWSPKTSLDELVEVMVNFKLKK